MKPTIRLEPLLHRDQSQVGIFFSKKDYSAELKSRLKDLDCRYSNTHKCWYTAAKSNTVNRLFKGLVDLAYIDYEAFKKGSKQEFPQTSTPKHSAVLPERHREIFEAYCHILDAKGYADNTKRTYRTMVKIYLEWFGEADIDSVSNADVNRFLSEFVAAGGYSISYQRQMVGTIKLLYKKRSDRVLEIDKIDYPRKSRPLPKVFSEGEMRAIISSFKNLKHRCAISLQYGCGLRVSELLNLKLVDLNLDNGSIFIRAGKGNVDRRGQLSGALKKEIKRYLEAFQPKDFLFEGQNGGAFSANSVNAVLKGAAAKVGIKKTVSSHMLRHSYATHLMNKGVDLRLIQVLMGHKSSRTTEIYTHVSKQLLGSVPSPFDFLGLDDEEGLNTPPPGDNPQNK